MTYLPPADGMIGHMGPVGGPVLVLGLIALVVLLSLYALLLWAIYFSTRRREDMLQCPLDGRTAIVRFVVNRAGNAVDVRACSLLRHRVTCRKACLKAA